MLQDLFENGDLQACADATLKLACLLPFNATRCLPDFIDAVIQLLRATAHSVPKDQSSLRKMCLVQLGLGLISKHGRQIWFQLFSCILYTFERLFKLRKPRATSKGDDEEI